MAKYILVEEESDPEGGCEIWLYTNEDCGANPVVAVVNTVDRFAGDPPEGFHVAHTCRPHGEKIVEDLNARYGNS